MANWHFSEMRPGDRAREPQIEKFFAADSVADNPTGLIREGIQNSLDARSGSHVGPIIVKIGIYTDVADSPHWLDKYMDGFAVHFDASKSKMPPRSSGNGFRYLVFEDFGTTGLAGDPSQWKPIDGIKNPFFNYFRAEGLSDKLEGNRGRHGVGKHEFARASEIRTILGLTRRTEEDGVERDLLMGTAVLRTHQIGETTFLPDGWFGVPSAGEHGLVLPVTDGAMIQKFKEDFKIYRTAETGLSIVVPCLDSSVDQNAVARAVIAGFFYPILCGELIVEVRNETDNVTISADTIAAVIDTHGTSFASQMAPMISLARQGIDSEGWLDLAMPSDPESMKWERACIPDTVREVIQAQLEAQETVKLRVPVLVREKSDGGNQQHSSEFKIILKRDPSSDDGQVVFVRKGLIISDVRNNNRQVRCPGVRALVIVENGSLAKMLGDSENPAHTQWQYQLVKDKYIKAGVCISYVASSVPSVLRLLSDEQKKADPSLLIDLFSLPAELNEGPKTKQKRKKPGGETEPPPPPPPAKPKRYKVQKVEDGFVIRAGDPEAIPPPALEVKVAYDVRRGNPLSKYRPADFRIGLGSVKCEYEGCAYSDFGDNWLIVNINDPDFTIRVTGFDTRRDLHIDVKVKELEGAVDGAAA